MYAEETWTISTEAEGKIGSPKVLTCRRIIRIFCKDHSSNESILDPLKEKLKQ